MTPSPPPDPAAPPSGAAVDPRLVQANERTLLAWLRTGLALIAFGFVLARLGVWLRIISSTPTPGGGAQAHEAAWVGGLFVALGALGNAGAVLRYRWARAAIRRGRELDDGGFPLVFGVVVTALSGLVGLLVLLRLL